MADSVLVFPPGFRVTDANDNPVNNAKIKFREAGPGATKTVHSDQNLTVALGHTVRTRADGQPVVSEGSSTTVLIYVGPDPYHIEIADANDAIVVPAKDNVKGAAVLSPAAPSITPLPVITTGSPLTLDATHKGKLINANGNTLTFSDATVLGDNWHVYVRCSAGQVILSAASGISFEGQSFTLRALLPGEGMHIACDGTAFRVISHTAPLLASQGPSVIQIADRVNAAPGAPTPGARYIVTANFSSFTTHQIIEYNGTGFNAYTPPTDCGWVAYVQDEDRYYAFINTTWSLVAVHIAGLQTEAAPDDTADFIPFHDVSAAEPRKALPTNFKRAGGMQLLNSGTVSSAASLDVVLTGFVGYRALKLILSSFIPVTDSDELWGRVSTDGGSTYDAAGYSYAGEYSRDSSSSGQVQSASDTKILMASTNAGLGVSNVAAEGGLDAEITIHDQTDTSRYPRLRYDASYFCDGAETMQVRGTGSRENAQDTDALRIMFSTGNIASGKWALYGLI